VPQTKRQVDGSEAAFLRTRRLITRSLAGPIGDALPKLPGLLDDVTPEQAKEIVFNDRKERRAHVEAFLSGFLKEEDISNELVDEASRTNKRL